MTTPITSNTLGVNVFTAPGKAMVGERPKPFGEAFGFDPITSTLIFGEHDAVLVDALTTVAEAEAHFKDNLQDLWTTHQFTRVSHECRMTTVCETSLKMVSRKELPEI